jgi:threonine dehydrogenase-like Zn-dependent dehydrogenase
VVIDGIGSNETVLDGLAACDRGGRIVVYGVPEGVVNYPLNVAYSNDVTLAISRLYNSNFDLPLKLVAERKVRVKDIITHRVRLDEAPALIHRILSREEEAIKVMISPSQD